MAIYWILHKPLSAVDWQSDIEGNPGYFYEKLDTLQFVDIADFELRKWFENRLIEKKTVALYNLDLIDKKRYLKINTYADLYSWLNKTNSHDIFVFQQYVSKSHPINIVLHQLNKKNRKSVLLGYWKMPILDVKTFQDKKRLKRLFLNGKELLFTLIRKTIDLFYKKSNYFDYLISSGIAITDMISKEVKIKKVIPAHSVSYDNWFYFSKLDNSFMIDTKYLVYIDQGLFLQQNRFVTKNDSEAFQKEIVNTMDFWENKLDMPIIIANHPRVQYPDGFWGTRRSYTGKSFALIKGAERVIGHFSTTILWSWLEKKDLILLTSPSEYFIWHNEVLALQNLLGGDLFDMKSCSFILHEGRKDFPLTEFMTLLPEAKEKNKEIIYHFLFSYL
jgi:hypothetical protein